MARSLANGARQELLLTPKPGLVDRRNNGAHPDLSYALMDASIGIVSKYLGQISESLIQGETFESQKLLGIDAERQLFLQLGTNTHKGYIFLSGMLLIACWDAVSDLEAKIREALSRISFDFFRTAPIVPTNGQCVRDKFQVSGIVGEVAAGLPSMFEVALPTYRAAMTRYGDPELASFCMLARLMQVVEDTTTLHRAGSMGLYRLKKDGAELERIISDSGDYLRFLQELDAEYIRMNMTMGGVADMIGLSLGYLEGVGERKTVISLGSLV